jgi:hypothetical protein
VVAISLVGVPNPLVCHAAPRPSQVPAQAAFVHPLLKLQEKTCRIHYLQFSVVCCIFILLSFDLLMALSAMSCKGAVALFVVFETFDDRFNQQRNK